jgi:hypothetical protein
MSSLTASAMFRLCAMATDTVEAMARESDTIVLCGESCTHRGEEEDKESKKTITGEIFTYNGRDKEKVTPQKMGRSLHVSVCE